MNSAMPGTGCRRFVVGLVVALFAVSMAEIALAATCDNKTAKSSISWTFEIEPIFHTCHFCHEGAAPEQLIMAPGLAYKFLVNIPSTESQMMRVDPGNPENSYILYKLRGTHMENGGQGVQMPIGFDPLPEKQIQMIADWIKDCSPDN